MNFLLIFLLFISFQINSDTLEDLIIEASDFQWKTIKKQLPLNTEKQINDSVQCIAKNIISSLEGPFQDIEWEIVVFESEEINAFALPGGKIGIFSGLIDLTRDEEELAAIIGHEIIHVIKGHAYESLKKQLKASLAAQIFDFGDSFDQFNSLLIQLPFNRGQETEADLLGLKIIAKAGFNPIKSWFIWEKMEIKQRYPKFLEFVQTHPHPSSRIESIKKNLPESLKIYSSIINHKPNCDLR